MSITSLDMDLENLTLTLIADFDASIDRVWELWSNPRKLERWGPATLSGHLREARPRPER